MRVGSRQDLDALFGLFEKSITVAKKSHTLFEAGQRRLEPETSRFELVNNDLQFVQRPLEGGRGVRQVRIGHGQCAAQMVRMGQPLHLNTRRHKWITVSPEIHRRDHPAQLQ